VVHLALSRRSHGSEAGDGGFDGVLCGVVEVGPKYPSLAVISFFRLSGHFSLLVGPINKTQGVVAWLSLLLVFILQSLSLGLESEPRSEIYVPNNQMREGTQ
jgi:hypothetical protein